MSSKVKHDPHPLNCAVTEKCPIELPNALQCLPIVSSFNVMPLEETAATGSSNAGSGPPTKPTKRSDSK